MRVGTAEFRPTTWLVLLLCNTAHVHAQAHLDHAACLEDVDGISGSRFLWNCTQADTTVCQPCPDGAMEVSGTSGICRACALSSSSPSGGVWEDPDVSSCYNLEMKLWVRGLVSSESGSTKQMVEQVDALHMIIEQSVEEGLLYPNDIRMGTAAVKVVARDIHLVEDALNDTLALVTAYADLVGAFTSPQTKSAWVNFNDKAEVAEQASSILTSTELLARNLFTLRQEGNIELTSSEESDDSTLWNHIVVESDTMDFEIAILDFKLETETLIELRGANGSTSVEFAVEMLEQLHMNESMLGLYRAQFTTLAQLLSGMYESSFMPEHLTFMEDNSSHPVGSDVLSTTVLGVEEKDLSSLPHPVVLTFRHEGQFHNYRGQCYFLNMTAQSTDDQWSNRGCHVTTYNETHTSCECWHLTNFALLMDLFNIGVDIAEGHLVALTYLSYIGGTLSVLGCILSVGTYEILRLNSEHIRIHEMLALAVTLSQLTFFIGFDRTGNKHVCKALAGVLHYFLLCLFSWMLIEGVHLYVSLIKVFRRERHFTKYLAVGWGLPLVNVCITLSVFLDDYVNEQYCWLSNKVLLIGFVPFVALTVLANTGVLVAVVRTMLRSQRRGTKTGKEDVSAIRTGVKATLVLLPLLGLSWMFGFMSINPKSTLVFTYLFTIFNSLQGVMFFIFHCALNRDVRAGILHYYRRRKSDSQCTVSQDYMSRDLSDQDVSGQLPAITSGKVQDTVRSFEKRGSAYSTASSDTTTTMCDTEGQKKSMKNAVDASDITDFQLDPLALNLEYDSDPPPPYDTI